MRRFQTRANRSGVTLIELLVVATMMLALAAVSVPAIKPMMESQLTSNAASTVSTYLNRARARAMTTGRSCGVAFEYFSGTWDGDPNGVGSASLVLRQVETPPYYSGLDAGSCVTVLTENDAINNGDGKRSRQITNIIDPYWGVYVAQERAPKIQFNGIGPYYPILFDNGNAYIEKIEGVETPACSNAPFKVIRDPRQTMTAPVGLPQGAVVDLEYSGTDSKRFALGSDVTIIFSPSGEVDYIADKDSMYSPTDTIYFLVGRWDRISALGSRELESTGETVSAAEDGLWNYEDVTNFWVAVNPRSGLVSTAEVNMPVNYTFGESSDEAVYESREFARMSKRNLGGH